MRSNGAVVLFFQALQENWKFYKHNGILKGLSWVLFISAQENFSETVGDAYPTALNMEPKYF